VTATTAPTVSGVPVNYRRSAVADADGTFAVTVAQPGTYRVGNRTVVVEERAVTNGSRVRVGRTGNASRA
jgi:dolichyl-diphosphooligosaccharide--protein glycosyltransferase